MHMRRSEHMSAGLSQRPSECSAIAIMAVRSVVIATLCITTLAQSQPRELSSFLGSTPELDGILRPGEWVDAQSWQGIDDWMAEFLPLPNTTGSAPVDLNATIWVKHDSSRLYFAFEIMDDRLFRYDEPAWLPSGNPSADNLTQAGWPWFGDEIEVLLNPSNTWSALNQTINGTGLSWQMVVNTGKSRLGGQGQGGLLEGEPRSSDAAWETYNAWILSGAMTAAVGVYRSGSGQSGGRYVVEWGISFNPCLQLGTTPQGQPVYYDTAAFPSQRVPIGLNIAVGDVDSEEASDGNPYGLRHEMWWNGTKADRTNLCQFGTLWLEPGPMR